MLGEIKTVDDYVKAFQKETNTFRDSLFYIKTCTPTALTEEEGLVQVYKNFILEERKPEQLGDKPPPKSAIDNYKKARIEAVLQPRLISVRGYQDLFDQALQASVLR